MIYHPEGVIRPTPATASNTTEYVYDYFIKDYLGNVRVVLTEEDAIYTQKFLATMEEVYRQIEEDNFDHISETAQPLPPGYPVDGSVAFNEQIAKLSEATGTEIGPSIVLPVKRGDKVSLSSRYFYEEVGQNVTYDNVNLLVNEILMSLATSGAGVLRLNEAGLIDIAAGNGQYGAAILNLLSNSFDTSDVSKPHSYMIWMLYDNNMKLIPEGSGAKRVTDPNQLGTLIEQDIPALTDGYLHCFVSNTGLEPISYDNFMVTYLRGKTRQINHYYPYGLSISSLSYSDEYLNKYTSKELQTGEFGSVVLSSGLEMFDFGSRFYDPALGRWFTPDPAEQFANPYLAMGCNPVVYIDPDGEFIFTALALITGQLWALPIAIGADLGAFTGGIRGAMNPEVGFWVGAGRGAAVGAVGGALSMVGGAGMTFAANLALGTGQGAITGAMDAALWGTDIGKGALWGAAGGAAFTTFTSENLSNSLHGKGFKTNSNVFEDFASGEYTTSTGVWQQDALDYFGFDGDYQAKIGDNWLRQANTNDYYGATNPNTGDIHYGDLAFKSYDDLLATVAKEEFTRQRALNGMIRTANNAPISIKYYPEEAIGFRHVFYNSGLYPNATGNPFQLANSYWFQVNGNHLMKNHFWDFIYNIPRRF